MTRLKIAVVLNATKDVISVVIICWKLVNFQVLQLAGRIKSNKTLDAIRLELFTWPPATDAKCSMLVRLPMHLKSGSETTNPT